MGVGWEAKKKQKKQLCLQTLLYFYKINSEILSL